MNRLCYCSRESRPGFDTVPLRVEPCESFGCNDVDSFLHDVLFLKVMMRDHDTAAVM